MKMASSSAFSTKAMKKTYSGVVMANAVWLIMKVSTNCLNGPLASITFKPCQTGRADVCAAWLSGTLVTVRKMQIGIITSMETPTTASTARLPPMPKSSNASAGANCATRLPTTPAMDRQPVMRERSL